MKFSTTLTLQYPTPFSAFSVGDFLKGLDWAKESGLDGAELCISHYRGLDLGAVKAQLDERGLACPTISTGQARTLEQLSLVGAAPQKCRETQERFMQHIDAAAYLGSKVTIGLMRGVGSKADAERDVESLAQAMLPIVDYADHRGVELILEPLNRYETAMLNSVEETMDFIERRLGNPDCLGILWDLFHANIEEADYARCIARMGRKLMHIHIADSNRMFPGYGHTPVKQILASARKAGYAGYTSFECLNLPSIDVVLRETKTWVASVRA